MSILPGWYFLGKLMGTFEKYPMLYPVGTLWTNWQVLLKSTHHVPAGYDWTELMGSFTKNSHLYPVGFWWVN